MKNEAEIREQISIIQQELKKKPKSANLIHDLGVGHYLLGEFSESVKYLQKAVDLAPNNVAFLFNLGNAFNENDQHDFAIDTYLRALDQNPNHIPSLNNLADCYEAVGQSDKAHELFHYLTRINGEDALSHFNLGNFFLRQNQHIEAAKCYEEAIKRDETFTDAYHNIAWILHQAKANAEALEYIQKGLNTDPGHEEMLELKKKISGFLD
ncbi:tetratricopeptide repeat protein [Rhodohalobacter sp.]|uniref:tetratricopeptide repeat protein n=1 Tax=Rhodohalobacter sp. TaxID=1974210 RepID=UPI00356A0262